jgi:hypothetical protein
MHATKVVTSRETRERTIGDFDYFGISLTLELEAEGHGWYHPDVILRKQRAEKNWSRAKLFSHEDSSTTQVFALPDDEFLRRLHPWPCE